VDGESGLNVALSTRDFRSRENKMLFQILFIFSRNILIKFFII
jgi:hypothetical protein